MGVIQKAKPYLFMIFLQFGMAVMTILTKMAFDQGMSSSVLVVYRHAFATVMIAPFALFLERKSRPKFTFRVFVHVFFLGLIGIVINLNFYYMGLKLTTSTIATALSNLLPAMTFVMAVLLRMESIKIKEIRSMAKVFGTMICVGGAMLMTFYKGPMLPMLHHHHHAAAPSPLPAHHPGGSQWLKGSMLVILGTIGWAALFVHQSAALKVYPAELTLTTLMCLMGTIQGTVFGAIVEPHPAKWALGWDVKLLCSAFSALAGSALPYYLQGVCMREKGPVFATAFIPLSLIIVAFLGSIFLAEDLYLGCVIGGVLITTGLYSVLWGKVEKTTEDPSGADIPGVQLPNVNNAKMPEP